MDFGGVLRVLGLLLLVEAVFMTPSLGISLYYGEGDTIAFAISAVLGLIFGIAAYYLGSPKGTVRYREGFFIVSSGWILASLFGALPFYFFGTFPSFVDAFFEVVSGFTTTGATVLVDIESQPHGILFWRSLTHWLGGMGILVFTLAILPRMGMGTFQIFRTESPGPTPGKLVPKIGKTAQILYTIYIAFSVVEVLALKLAGMSLFDAFTHTFATMGTGGFSTMNASIGAFNSVIYEVIIIAFMFIAGVNFSLYYEVMLGNSRALLKDSEFRFYSLVVVVSTILVTLNIYGVYGSLFESLRYGVFQVVSIISTTGFGTANFDAWPDLSRMILLILMFFGGSAGSTGGAIKHIRILIVFKYIKRALYRLIHPRAVIPVRIGGKAIPEEVLQDVTSYILLYLSLFLGFSLILLTQNMDLVSAISAVAATLGNIGPGLGLVGPTSTYADLTTLTKLLLSFAMILGRLEIYAMLVLLNPVFWRK